MIYVFAGFCAGVTSVLAWSIWLVEGKPKRTELNIWKDLAAGFYEVAEHSSLCLSSLDCTCGLMNLCEAFERAEESEQDWDVYD